MHVTPTWERLGITQLHRGMRILCQLAEVHREPCCLMHAHNVPNIQGESLHEFTLGLLFGKSVPTPESFVRQGFGERIVAYSRYFLNASIYDTTFAISFSVAYKFNETFAAPMYWWKRFCLRTLRRSRACSSTTFLRIIRIERNAARNLAIKIYRNDVPTAFDNTLDLKAGSNCPKNNRMVTGLLFWNLYGFMIVSMGLANFAAIAAIFSVYLR